MMKKLIYAFLAIAVMLINTGCDSIDDWTTGPALEHIYYVGFYKTGTYSDNLNYEIAANGTAQWRVNTGTWMVTGSDGVSSNIPFELHSQLKYSYDIASYFYVTNDGESALNAGTDYVVLDESGNTMTLSDGKYTITWSQANKETIKNIRIKRLTSATGVLKVNTLDPAKGTPSTTEDEYIDSTRNNLTDQYDLRGLTHDFNKTTVTFN
ncbi:MAG: hypothetical protein LBV72_16975 [Tannerella sp.]|jgi:uncharacterized lipoprotein NlpE involved in copper resistance|nr:hypothetical protein [Tannerella sp.]